MRRWLHDDGRAVTLDLHGTGLAEAERRLVATLRIAAERGRTSVRVVHGSSTSDPRSRNPTIKYRLEEMLAEDLLPGVTAGVSIGEATLLSLPVGGPVDGRQITPLDVLA